MSEFKSEFVYNVETPFDYHKGGQVEKARELILKAPSNRQRRESAKLKQGFFRALKSMADNKGDVDAGDQKGDGAISGDEVVSIIMMSNVDLVDYQESFRDILINDSCFVGDIKLTSPMYDSMSDADTEKLMGEYIATFLLASQLKKMQIE